MLTTRRTTVRATPTAVWGLLSTPARWPEFDPFVHRVAGVDGALEPGQRLMIVTRPIRVPASLDVLEVLPEQLLRYAVQLAPGLRVDVLWELAPALRGGTLLTVSEDTAGLFARPGGIPVGITAVVRLHRLAARAAADMRAAGRSRRPGAA